MSRQASFGAGLWGGALALLLTGCQAGLRPIAALNQPLSGLGDSQSPSLNSNWLALISSRPGSRAQVQLIDRLRNAPVPLPGLNRPDSLPISVAVDQR
ncbi:MAG: hypothetical protein FJ070_10210, partial [Cyanobacteria bacterium K_DeepCast_150m_m2_101]|nr:hypothetical protein [Cyanobacteria bacterium K_DeepCast_150m_m2_101]